jgi:hypothetical protein
MRFGGTHGRRVSLAAWCAGVVAAAGAYGIVTLAAILGVSCEESLDPQRFCAWWGHSALPTLIGVPGVLAFGCYASASARSRAPVTVAGVLVVLVCAGLREAALGRFY